MARLLFICSAKGSYTRNDVLRRALRGATAEYAEIVSERKTYPARLLEVAGRWPDLHCRSDVTFLGFLAQPLVPLAVLLGGRRVVMDVFISVYDTLCLDRRTFDPDGWIGRAIRRYEAWSLSKAQVLLTDTEENADFYAELFRLPRERFFSVPVSANPELFSPGNAARNGNLKVVYYCTFLPLHGAEVVFDAAQLLKDRNDLEFLVVGQGRTAAALDRRLQEQPLSNLRRLAWMEPAELARSMASADIFLAGHFSRNPKALRVVPGKAYQAMSLGRPTVLGDNAANRRLFRHRQDAYFCEPNSPRALADAILTLADDAELRNRLGCEARRTFQAQFHPDVIAAQLRDILARSGVI